MPARAEHARARRSCCTTSAALRSCFGSGFGSRTTRLSSRPAIRSARVSGMRFDARTSRSRGRFRSSTRAKSFRCGKRAMCVAAASWLGGIDLFCTLPEDSRLALSRTAQEHIFAAGEAIVRQDDAGDSMYVILSRPRAGRPGAFGQGSRRDRERRIFRRDVDADGRSAHRHGSRHWRCQSPGDSGGALPCGRPRAPGSGRAHQSRRIHASHRARLSARHGRAAGQGIAARDTLFARIQRFLQAAWIAISYQLSVSSSKREPAPPLNLQLG